MVKMISARGYIPLVKSSTFLEFAQFDTNFKKGTMLCCKLLWTEMWDPNQKKWGLHKLLRTIILRGYPMSFLIAIVFFREIDFTEKCSRVQK